MSDFTAWLGKLGLGKYAAVFAENAIDFDVIAQLDEKDLKELGIALGDRKRLLTGIAALSSETLLTAAGDSGVPAEGVPTQTVSKPQAERRQLTVMFADLVDSTALSSRLDPEDLRELILAYQNTVAGEISRYDGHIAKYMGDGVLAYFGWPQAHEDEAERAVRAGLAVTAAVAKLTAPNGTALAARVGIATGLVVVGDLIGAGAAQEQTVVGETPNLAARLQALAEPGVVLIDDNTRRLVVELFEMTDLGTPLLKGLSQPVQVWRVIEVREIDSRFEVRTKRLTPLVGREGELGLLLDRWHQAKSGEGQVILLSGEPGIGKSRLVSALQERLGSETYRRLRYQCSPFHSNSALYPVIQQLQRGAGLSPDQTVDERLDRLARLLSLDAKTNTPTAALFAALLAIPYEARYGVQNLSPQQRKAHTFTALIDQLLTLSQRQPVLFIIEDTHWIDPSTQELLERTLTAITQHPVLMLITHRPEWQPGWTGRFGHIVSLSVGRLGRTQTLALLRSLSGDAADTRLLEQIALHSDGVPLFAEELTKSVLEADDAAATGFQVPETLQASLLSRLDRLGDAKEIAQVGAVIGREFDSELLAQVVENPRQDLATALSLLLQSGLVFQHGAPASARFTFKHALVQDTAYASLLHTQRRHLHARIASILAERSAETTSLQPELVAHHYTQAGMTSPAVDYWYRAGLQAIARSAQAEAVAHLERGLTLLNSLPEDRTRFERELDLLVSLGPALMAIKGYGAPQVGEICMRVRQLCKRLADTSKLPPILVTQGRFHFIRAELDKARDVAQELLGLARQTDNCTALHEARLMLSIVLWYKGNFKAANEHANQAENLKVAHEDTIGSALYGQDPRVNRITNKALLLWYLGYPDRALDHSRQAMQEAHALDHAFSRAYALAAGCWLNQRCRNIEATRQLADSLITLSIENGFAVREADGRLLMNWALMQQQPAHKCIEEMQKSLQAYAATGSRYNLTYYLALLAETGLALGEITKAQAALDLAANEITATGVRFYEVELLRLQGECLLAATSPGNQEDAEACFRRSLDMARAQGAKSWELRAATSLARLWRDQEKYQAACDLLAPVYGWFTEGFATGDLQDAKALLDELTI